MYSNQNNTLPTIHTYTSGEAGIFANAYIIETQNGLVIVDATVTVSESEAFKNRLESINKPLLAILLTHSHPDHVAGVTNLVSPSYSSADIPIVALESVEKLMRATEEPKRTQWSPVYKEEWISRWTYPNRLVKDREEVTFDGITYRVYDFGPGGDSDANSVWIIENEPRLAFVGDLVFNGTHSYIADNHLYEWLKNLERTRDLLSDISTIYPGHGNSGSMELIESQKRYLLAYSGAVKELSNGKPKLTDQAKKELTRKMEEFLPGGDSPSLLLIVLMRLLQNLQQASKISRKEQIKYGLTVIW